MKKRSYKQNCALAFAGDILGERWTMLLLRELLIQPCRFKELNLWLKGMGTNLLTSRLRELEQDGIIEKQQPENKRSAYELTQLGLNVEPVILSQIRWGLQLGQKQQGYLHCEHWDLLAMKALFVPLKGKKNVSVQFNSPSLSVWVSILNQTFTHGIGISQSTDIVIESSIQTFQQMLNNGYYENNAKVNDFVDWFEILDRE